MIINFKFIFDAQILFFKSQFADDGLPSGVSWL